ncbi:replication initiation protein [Buttiauxella sp. S04-F03]|uniref:replication initiation protein n=1 Tax=Buttiauxella sp. S04-F03 TaxID=2904525 RepID=UPI001E34524C|nr:replication initiation protein [Buttiauxella sp. S04-F03]MCE0815009.1 replication initiation protein [Buttiauxella sp. S04-F03]
MSKHLAAKQQVTQPTMIYQHNDFVDAAYRLTIPGKRVLSMALGIVGNKNVKPDGTTRDEFGFISTITVADYAAIFEVDIKNASTEMLAGVMDLSQTAATIYVERAKGRIEGNFTIIPLIYKTTASAARTERGKYIIELHPELMGYIGLLERNFTAYDLLNCGRLTSFNQMRLYEQFSSHKNHGKKGGVNYGLWVTNFDFFRSDTFDLGDSIKDYPRTMKRRFLDAALDAINDTTDLFVEFTDKGRGKPWEFKIYSGDIADKKREKWRKERAEAELKAKEEKRLARLRKQIAAHQAEEATQ